MKNKKKAAAPIRVLLADDHAVLRKGLRLLLEEEGDITVVAEAGDGREAVDLVRVHTPDVVVMDITMPDLGGIEATRQIIADFPDTRVIALSIHKGKQFVQDMLRAGAAGYLLKESAPKELLDAVRAVMGGETILSRAITGVVVAHYMSDLKGDREAEGWESLTLREKKEARWAVEGLPVSEIASALGVDPETAEESRRRIMKKLGVASLAELSELTHDKEAPGAKSDLTTSSPVESPVVLKTKLYPPEVPKGHVHRRALVDRLTEHAGKPLILVSAPAGYGKSTLAACWLSEANRPVAWLSLDENENDLRSFMNAFIAAVGTVLPDGLPEIRTQMTASRLPPPQVLAGMLTNEIEKLEEDITLILDDFHLIEKMPVLDLITALLSHPLRYLHLVLISRRDPLLPLTSLRGGNLMHEIRLHDLCFTPEETAAYLQAKIGSPVEPSAAAAWAEKTEGWITGLQLASFSISHRGEAGSLLAELGDSAQYAREYLFNEVLRSQPPPMRRCLMSTSILDRFSAPLCEAVWGPEQEGPSGWKFVGSLKKENLFVISLDAEGRWFRYHHLFQQLLRNQVERHCSPDEIAAFHSRAGAWFGENGFVDEALDHLLAAGDDKGAADLFERNRFVPLETDQVHLLERWLSKFADEVIELRPALLMAKAWVLDYHFDLSPVPALLDTVESLRKESPPDEILSAEIDFFRGYSHTLMNEGAQGRKHLEAAAKNVPLAHRGLRGHIELIYGLAVQMGGRKDEAVGRLNGLLAQCRGGAGLLRSRLLIALVYIHVISGEFEQALAENLQLRELTARNRYDYAGLWSVYLDGVIHFFRNDLEAAGNQFSQVMEKRYVLHLRAALDGMAGLLTASQSLGRHDDVQAVLESMQEYLGSQSDPSFAVFARSCRARLAIMGGGPEEAGGWVREAPPPPENMLWWMDVPAVTHCRALLAEGSDESLESAEVRLRELLQLNRDNHNVLQTVVAMSLLAAVCQRRKKTDEALNFLELALELGAPGGVLRPFVEAAPDITPLLKKAAREGTDTEFARSILSAIGESAGSAVKDLRAVLVRSSGSQSLVEPLTKREIELLEHLAQRFSNNEIAEHLFISPTTVKSHLRSIFQKLDVGNRREAVARSVELGILQ